MDQQRTPLPKVTRLSSGQFSWQHLEMKSSRCSTHASNEVREDTIYCSGISSADMAMDTEKISPLLIQEPSLVWIPCENIICDLRMPRTTCGGQWRNPRGLVPTRGY